MAREPESHTDFHFLTGLEIGGGNDDELLTWLVTLHFQCGYSLSMMLGPEHVFMLRNRIGERVACKYEDGELKAVIFTQPKRK